MRPKLLIAIALACGVSAAGGFFAATGLAQDQKTHFQRDEPNLDATGKYLTRQIDDAIVKLKQVARETTAENFESGKEERERQLQAAISPLIEESPVLFLETIMLAIDNAVDQGGPPVKAFLISAFFEEKLGITGEQVEKDLAASQLGLGGLLIAYNIGSHAELPASIIYAEKKPDIAWIEIMKKHNVSIGQVAMLFEPNK